MEPRDRPGKGRVFMGALTAGLVLGVLCVRVAAPAHEGAPGALKSMRPGRVIEVMETDFLLPRGFRWLPGPMFYLTHEKDLGLTARQRGLLLAIAKEIMPETIREGGSIDRLKRQILVLSDGRKAIDSRRLRALLLTLGKREALANFDHIEAHKACLSLLTPLQRRRLFSLLGKP